MAGAGITVAVSLECAGRSVNAAIIATNAKLAVINVDNDDERDRKSSDIGLLVSVMMDETQHRAISLHRAADSAANAIR